MSKGKKLIAYVGCNHVANFVGGGISVFEVSEDGSKIKLISSVKDMPKRAGYLAYSPKVKVLYAVDERKTDGRGPITSRPRAYMSFRVNQQSGAVDLSELTTGSGSDGRPLSTVDEEKKLLFTANHGFFDMGSKSGRNR